VNAGRAGVTLVELLAALAILGLIAGLTGVSLGSLRPTLASVRATALARARSAAIQSGRPVAATLDSVTVRFLPDGRALGPGLDLLTGAPHATR
jgi:prepilin-type N-terminal cleavage/methylation domain-containing protein